MSLIRQITKSMLTAVVPRNKLLVQGPCTPSLALTFDDGPHPELTPRLLDCLNARGLKGTFFVIGRLAEQYPDLIRRMDDEGHEVANHTYSHSEPDRTSSDIFLREIRRTDDVLSAITGRVPTLVRPPKGQLSLRKLLGLWRAGKTVVLWNRDPRDFRMQRVDEIDRWCDEYEPRHGDIVLFHDIHPYAIRAIEAMSSRGHFDRYAAIPISRWLPLRTQNPKPVTVSNTAS